MRPDRQIQVDQIGPTLQNGPIGLIAGWGRFPILAAESLARRGLDVIGVGIAGHADPSVAASCRAYREFGLTQLGGHIEYLRRQGVRQAVFAGKIQKTLLFHPRFLWKNIPDLYCVRTYFSHFITRRRDCADDSLLSAAVYAFENRGIGILPTHAVLPELIVTDGLFGNTPLTNTLRQDIAFGWRLAKEIGRLDIGQTVAVKGQAVLAIEAIEGTDECIRRAGQLCPRGQFVVVKVAKPQQDMRFDVPTIGVGTIQTMHQSGAAVLAVEAHRTIVMDPDQVARLAAQFGITIVTLTESSVAEGDGTSPKSLPRCLAPVGAADF